MSNRCLVLSSRLYLFGSILAARLHTLFKEFAVHLASSHPDGPSERAKNPPCKCMRYFFTTTIGMIVLVGESPHSLLVTWLAAMTCKPGRSFPDSTKHRESWASQFQQRPSCSYAEHEGLRKPPPWPQIWLLAQMPWFNEVNTHRVFGPTACNSLQNICVNSTRGRSSAKITHVGRQ